MKTWILLVLLFASCTVQFYVKATQPVKTDTVIVHDRQWQTWPRGDNMLLPPGDPDPFDLHGNAVLNDTVLHHYHLEE